MHKYLPMPTDLHPPFELPLEDSPYRLDNHGPVFILGCPRSGTTFLSECISAIDGIEEFVGVLCPPRFCHAIATQARPEDADLLMAVVRDIFWNSFIRRRLARTERFGHLLLKRFALHEYLHGPSLEGSLFCYKEPFLCFAAETFANYFPNCQFIHIVRDGRDNADSLERTYPDALSDQVIRDPAASFNKNSEIGLWTTVKGVNVPWWVPPSDVETYCSSTRYGRCTMMWREMTLRARRLAWLGSERYLEIRYEDFVASPQETGEQICGFLKRPVTARLRNKLRRAVRSSVGVSSRRQPADRLREATTIAGDLIQQMGYSAAH